MSYIKIWLHCVWCVKDRAYYLPNSFRAELLKHFRANAEDKKINLDFINAHENHVHALINMGKQQNIATIMQYMKGESSFWINSLNMFPWHFAWQDDYYAVSIGQSQVERTRKYIQTQDAHHQRISLDDEIKLLEKQAVPEIETYHDHRMALAFAPACQVYGPVAILDPMVVTKSYPGYWEDLKKVGFEVKDIV